MTGVCITRLSMALLSKEEDITFTSPVRRSSINTTQAGCLSTLNRNNFVPVLRKLRGKLPDLYAEGSNVPSSYPDTTTLNLQNIKDNHVGQPAETHATPYRIHALPLLSR